MIESLLPDDKKAASIELYPYLADSFGNSTRIDYGSGHEASFLIFCLCLFKIGLFREFDRKAVALRVFNKYLKVCRSLQVVYHMEPAGSRGVHAIDDFQFIPFLWGSAQLIGSFISHTKTGPFHEHSNQLWNISAVPSWEKVNSGMFKMYEGEVLKKFPVVQHFRFGSLFSFEKKEGAPTESLVRECS
uniref:Serine/threonine-protein phosphatase 2A activator n=1 Tax=Heterorhabditis bacteriophora TaxID=37862 RepID=A0A1I7WQX8_HETBA